eukprot:512154-Rhodomonas_salina.2
MASEGASVEGMLLTRALSDSDKKRPFTQVWAPRSGLDSRASGEKAVESVARLRARASGEEGRVSHSLTDCRDVALGRRGG